MVNEIIKYFSEELTTYRLIYSKFKGLYFVSISCIITLTIIVMLIELKFKNEYIILWTFAIYIFLLAIILYRIYKKTDEILESKYSKYNLTPLKFTSFIFDNYAYAIQNDKLKKELDYLDIKSKKKCKDLISIVKGKEKNKKYNSLFSTTVFWGSIGVIFTKFLEYLFERYKMNKLPILDVLEASLIISAIIFFLFLFSLLFKRIIKSFYEKEYKMLVQLSNHLEAINFELPDK